MQKHLIIKSLHRNESFLAKASKALEMFLFDNNAEISIRDLYSMDFNPVLTSTDFQMLKSGQLPIDIQSEQKFIKETDIIWFIFPIWWTSMPAILKGYIDRILLNGFAYAMENNKPKGLLRDKKVVIINSMGESFEDYKKIGMFNALKLTIDTGIFKFTGMEVIDHLYFTSIMTASNEEKENYTGQLIEVARKALASNQ